MPERPQMDKVYNPQAFEEQLYNWWEAQGYFKPETQYALGLAKPGQKPFVISMPAPSIWATPSPPPSRT